MKAKWFIRGMGTGIVLTALILCMAYRSNRNDGSVIKEAKELGMVFPENETGDISRPEKDQAEQLAKDQEKEKKEQEQEKQKQEKQKPASGAAVSQKNEKDQEAKDKLDKSSKDISQGSKYQEGKKSFVVRSGLLSSSVAREMEEAGIIDDADAFDDYIEKNGYGKQLRSGKYKIPDGADYETIAKIITRQN